MGNSNKSDLSPIELQNLIVERDSLKFLNKVLKDRIKDLEFELETYKANLPIGQNNANLNVSQALGQINILSQQNNYLKCINNNLNTEVFRLNQQIIKLNSENDKLKFYCNKMDLMLLNKMQQVSFLENMKMCQNFNCFPNNNIINNNNFNNGMMNNNQNFNYENMNNSKNIIFNVNNIFKCSMTVLPNNRLGDSFCLALYKNGFKNMINIKNYIFILNCKNLSSYFYENKKIRDINMYLENYARIDVFHN